MYVLIKCLLGITNFLFAKFSWACCLPENNFCLNFSVPISNSTKVRAAFYLISSTFLMYVTHQAFPKPYLPLRGKFDQKILHKYMRQSHLPRRLPSPLFVPKHVPDVTKLWHILDLILTLLYSLPLQHYIFSVNYNYNCVNSNIYINFNNELK